MASPVPPKAIGTHFFVRSCSWAKPFMGKMPMPRSRYFRDSLSRAWGAPKRMKIHFDAPQAPWSAVAKLQPFFGAERRPKGHVDCALCRIFQPRLTLCLEPRLQLRDNTPRLRQPRNPGLRRQFSRQILLRGDCRTRWKNRRLFSCLLPAPSPHPRDPGQAPSHPPSAARRAWFRRVTSPSAEV